LFRLVEKEGEMALGRRRYPFEMPFPFSLDNILSIVANHFSKQVEGKEDQQGICPWFFSKWRGFLFPLAIEKSEPR
jgi:hypothetical protein